MVGGWGGASIVKDKMQVEHAKLGGLDEQAPGNF